MIAKLVTHAATRTEAIEAMSVALDDFVVEGIQHNVPFLSALMAHPRWREGRLSTGFIAEEFPEGFQGATADSSTLSQLAVVALTMEILRKDRLDRLAGRLAPHAGNWREKWVVSIGGKTVELESPTGIALLPMEVEIVLPGADEPVTVLSNWMPGDLVWEGAIDDEPLSVQVRPALSGYRLLYRGIDVVARVMTPRIAALHSLMPEKLPPDTSKFLLCPMPGLVISLTVEEGQEVKAGETLAIVEAMKMENVLRADRDLTVQSISAKQGDSLAVDAVIMEFV
jgi:propionyl-CoA carboxylase alpha chain